MTRNSSCAHLQHLSHSVYITDSKGIYDTFRLIKTDLTAPEAKHLTLLYCLQAGEIDILFQKELAVLQTRFPTSLIVRIIDQHLSENSIQNQIEVTVNSDVTGNSTFLVIGQQNFVHSIDDMIRYLNIKSNVSTTIL